MSSSARAQTQFIREQLGGGAPECVQAMVLSAIGACAPEAHEYPVNQAELDACASAAAGAPPHLQARMEQTVASYTAARTY